MKISHLHSTKGREPYGLFVLLVQLDFTISGGFLDGKFGFILSLYHYMYTVTKYVKLYYLIKSNGKL